VIFEPDSSDEWLSTLKNRSALSEYGVETSSGVFHAHSWSTKLPTGFAELLTYDLVNSNLNKLRFCLHPGADEIMQVTYLAFKAPYEDRIHKHPHRPEVVIPLTGEALHTTYGLDGLKISQNLISGKDPVCLSTHSGVWHSMEILTPLFLMVEVGVGPFNLDSTIFFEH
jgi:cupin fold WbuC family metalloprotein